MNAGKSRYNEDQAGVIYGKLNSRNRVIVIPYVYAAIFDGHGGPGIAIKASKELHRILHQSLEDVLDILIEINLKAKHSRKESLKFSAAGIEESAVIQLEDDDDDDLEADDVPTTDELIIGSLESSFWAFDRLAARDLKKYRISGGSTALVALFILNKLYLSSAGDSRAAAYYPFSSDLTPLSFDHTPDSDRQRLQLVAFHRPDLLRHPTTNQKLYNRHVLNRKRIQESDIGTPVLYKDFYMSGWSVREIVEDDIKLVPMISGKEKCNRLLNTMGVTRGLGDHKLLAKCSQVPLKEFLTPHPEVTVTDLSENTGGLLIMGSDGLWDVLSFCDIHTYFSESNGISISETELAKEIVLSARGRRTPELYWEMKNGDLGSGDDISVFVISMDKVSSLINKDLLFRD